MTQHVLVIGGGQNAEHGISLETAAAIGEALRCRRVRGQRGHHRPRRNMDRRTETAREKRCRLAGRGIAAP
jgi:D-alanine-D-alanine ligase-like ATP-grasp enzyme